jgi:hypothetical protein
VLSERPHFLFSDVIGRERFPQKAICRSTWGAKALWSPVPPASRFVDANAARRCGSAAVPFWADRAGGQRTPHTSRPLWTRSPLSQARRMWSVMAFLRWSSVMACLSSDIKPSTEANDLSARRRTAWAELRSPMSRFVRATSAKSEVVFNIVLRNECSERCSIHYLLNLTLASIGCGAVHPMCNE